MARKTERAAERAPELDAEQTGGQEPRPAEGDIQRLVYFGPSIPYGKLRTSMILEGTGEEIREYLADVVDKYPEAERLLTTPENLAKAMDKAATKGNILHKYVQDMAAKIREDRKQERKMNNA